MELGFCVTASGRDQNRWVARIDRDKYDTNSSREECMKKCLQYGAATACEVVWYKNWHGCYVHHAEVAKGNGRDGFGCFVFKSKSKFSMHLLPNLISSDSSLSGFRFLRKEKRP